MTYVLFALRTGCSCSTYPPSQRIEKLVLWTKPYQIESLQRALLGGHLEPMMPYLPYLGGNITIGAKCSVAGFCWFNFASKNAPRPMVISQTYFHIWIFMFRRHGSVIWNPWSWLRGLEFSQKRLDIQNEFKFVNQRAKSAKWDYLCPAIQRTLPWSCTRTQRCVLLRRCQLWIYCPPGWGSAGNAALGNVRGGSAPSSGCES